MRIEKLLLVVAALVMVTPLAACGGSEGGQDPHLRDAVPERVGDYELQEVVNTDPNPSGAERTLQATYQSSDGRQIFLGLWSRPSEEEAEQGKQAIAGQLRDQGYRPVETFSVGDSQGDRSGTGLVLRSSEFETTLWTDNSMLAVVDAPRGGYGPDFYRALYSGRGGTSLATPTTNETTDSTTVVLTGMPVAVLPLAAVLALLVSMGLLKLYRQVVLRSMRTRAGSRATEPVHLEAPASADQPLRAVPDLTVLDHTSSITALPSVEGLYSGLLRAPWRTAAIYAGAGFCYALVLTATFLAATGSEILLFRFLLLFWIYAWPVVLTINLVAAATRRAKLAIASVYFLVLAVLGAISIARSPDFSWDQFVVLWVFTNLPATLLLLAFLNRRVRAVGPLVLAFMILAITGSHIALLIVNSDRRLLHFVADLGLATGLSARGIFIGLIVLGFAVFGVIGWLALRWIRSLYERKKISDQSVTLDDVWLMFGAVHSFGLVFEGVAWILSGLFAFVVYKVVARAGFSLVGREASPTGKSLKLLLLRVFSLGRRSERLFDQLGTHWRHVGSIRLIAGPDLATTTVEPHEFLDFLSGKLARRFIDKPQTLDLRISEMDIEPDQDGRFRVNDFFCYQDTWKMVLARLVSESDAVLMDLRSFSSENAGVLYEIDELINVVPLRRVVFVVDDTTDEQFLRQAVRQSWTRMRSTSPNRSSTPGQLRLFRFTGSGGELKQLLRTLSVAAKAAPQTVRGS